MYIDRNTREAKEVHARAVILCAQALESARILFNSATQSTAWPIRAACSATT